MQCDFRGGPTLRRFISDVTLTFLTKEANSPHTQLVTHVRKNKVEEQGIPRGVATPRTFVEQTVLGTEESGHQTSWCWAAVTGGDPAHGRPQPGWLPFTFIHLASTSGASRDLQPVTVGDRDCRV